jgi:hypothetical protein
VLRAWGRASVSSVSFAPRATWMRTITGGGLSECEIVEEAEKIKCNEKDLTPQNGGEQVGVQHEILGASEDGSYVYFVANGVLGDGMAKGTTPGSYGESGLGETVTCNLYAYHEGEIRFVARCRRRRNGLG